MKNISLAAFFTVLTTFLLTFLIVVIDEHFEWIDGLFTAYVASIVATVFTVVLALPLHAILSGLKITSAKWYVLAGALTGPVFILGFKPFGDDSVKDLAVQIVMCCSFGALSATVFWYFSVYRHRITASARGCKNFCVNGHLAGDCLSSRESRNDRKQRTD